MAVAVTVPWGGLLHYGVQLADGLARRGHRVDVLAPKDNELAAHTGPSCMDASLIPPVRRDPTRGSGPAYVLRRAGVAWRLTRAWLRIVGRGGSRRRYDVLILNADFELLPAAILAFLLALRPDRPALVIVAHNVTPFNRHGGGDLFVAPGLGTRLMGRIYDRADLVVVHGERSRAEFQALHPSAPVVVVPHGDEALFGGAAPPPAAEPRILFFGHWAKVKGLPVLMEAFDRLAARHPDARVTIAGTPVPADFDPELVRRWAAGHGQRVELVDHYVPIEDVAALFARARVVVAPYLVAYQSGVVHLAMTMGRAVVASRVGDLPASVRHGTTGLLVPAGDAGALAEALEGLVADPDRASAFGRAGRQRVLDHHSWEAVAARLEAAIAGVVGAERPRRRRNR